MGPGADRTGRQAAEAGSGVRGHATGPAGRPGGLREDGCERTGLPATEEPRNWAAAYALLAPALPCSGSGSCTRSSTRSSRFQSVNLFRVLQSGLRRAEELRATVARSRLPPFAVHHAHLRRVRRACTDAAGARPGDCPQSLASARRCFSTVFFLPYMTSTVAVTTVFMKLFVFGGPLSTFGGTTLRSHATPPGTPT